MNNSVPVEAVVAGHICLDICPDLSGMQRVPFGEAFLPGRLIAAGAAALSTGGAVSNTGLALNRLGISTRLAAKVGDDLFGQAILQIVASHGKGLAEGMILDPSAHTSYSVLVSYPGVDRIFLHCSGANDTFEASDVPFPVLETARLFHFGYPPLMSCLYKSEGEQLVEIFRRAKTYGVTTTLDMAFPDPSSAAAKSDWQQILARTLPWVDIFLPSVEEILFMLRHETYQSLALADGAAGILAQVTPELLSNLGQELLDLGAKVVVLKLGERGIYLRTGSPTAIAGLGRAGPARLSEWARREYWAPCFAVQVAGTTGAGDAAIAGFLSSLLRGYSPQNVLTLAAAVGACNVEAPDALSGILPWEETQSRIQGGWGRLPLELKAPGWQFDPDCRLWIGPCN